MTMLGFLNSGTAAIIVLSNNYLAKFYLTAAWRLKQVAGGTKKAKAITESAEFQKISRAQLNESEWAPSIVAALLFLHFKGIDAPLASTLVGVGCPLYFLGAAFTPFPGQIPGATLRYLGYALLIYETYLAVNT